MADEVSKLSRAVAALRVAVHAASRHGQEERCSLIGLGDALDRVMLALPSPAEAGDWRAMGHAALRMADAHAELRGAWGATTGPSVGLLSDRVLHVAVGLAGLIAAAGDAFREQVLDEVQPLLPRRSEAPEVQATPEPMPATIRFGAGAPIASCPGASFVARFIAYDERDAAEALRLLAAPASAQDGPAALQAEGGRRAEVSLCAPGLRVECRDEYIQSFVWTGRPVGLDFRVDVPADWSLPSTVLKFKLRVAGLVLAQFELELGFDAGAAPPLPRHSCGHRAAHSLFASYAVDDRARVLERMAALRAAIGIDLFLDCRDLNSGPQWQPRLEHEIAARDGFVLFWSKAAANSSWVAWEWDRALGSKGLEQVQVQMLDAGLQPPRALTGAYVGSAAA